MQHHATPRNIVQWPTSAAFFRSEDVGRGGGVTSASGYAGDPSGGSQHPQWGLPNMQELRRLGTGLIFSGHGMPGGPPLSRHPYYTLLRLYLEHFLPSASSSQGGAAAAAGAAVPGGAQLGGLRKPGGTAAEGVQN